MKEKKYIFLIIGVILIITSIIIRNISSSNEKVIEDSVDFQVVDSYPVKTNLAIDSIEIREANFYVIRTNSILYVVANNGLLDEELSEEDDLAYKTLYGTSEIITESMKNEIVNLYDEDEFNLYDEDELYESNTFEDTFGIYYLNTEKVYDVRENTNVLRDIASMFLEGGIALIVLFAAFSTDFIIDKIKR